MKKILAFFFIASSSLAQSLSWSPVSTIWVQSNNGTPTGKVVFNAWPTGVYTPTFTITLTPTQTLTLTNTPTLTITPTPTFTASPSPTYTGTLANTPTPGPTATYGPGQYAGSHLQLAGIDSLTLSNYSDWYDQYITKAKNAWGDGGPGYLPACTGQENYNGYYIQTDGTQQASTDNTQPGTYSIDGRCTYWMNTAGPSSLIYSPIASLQRSSILGIQNYPQTYDYVRMFYLQQPGGGSVSIAAGNKAFSLVNTSGPLTLAWVELLGDSQNTTITCNTVLGKVCIFGFEFFNKQGVMCSSIGIPGYHLDTNFVNARNASFFQQWLAVLKPDYFFMNGGRNDAGSVESGTSLNYCINRFVQEVQAGWPKCGILFFGCNANNPAFGVDTYLAAYRENFIQQFAAGNAGYLDNQIASGNYTQSVAAGFYNDGEHPNILLDQYIADNTFKYVTDFKPGYPLAAPWLMNQGVYKSTGSLFAHNFEFPCAQGVTQQVLGFGLAANSQSTVFTKLEVSMELEGTSMATKESILIGAQNNGSNPCQVTSFTTGTPIIDIQTIGPGTGSVTMTFGATIDSNNRLNVTVNPSTNGNPAPSGNVKIGVAGSWWTASNLTTGATPTPGVKGANFFQTY